MSAYRGRLRKFAVEAIGVFLFGLSGGRQESSAAVLIIGTEVGGDVVFEATGTLNLAGLIKITSGTSLGAIIPSTALLNLGATPAMSLAVDIYSGVSFVPSNFGPGAASFPAAGSGSRFAVSSNDLRVPAGFMGGNISSSNTYTGTTFAGLGVTPGTYQWDWGGDSVTLQIAPEPAPAILLLGAAVLACGRSRTRRSRE